MRISDWSSDVCSSDLRPLLCGICRGQAARRGAGHAGGGGNRRDRIVDGGPIRAVAAAAQPGGRRSGAEGGNSGGVRRHVPYRPAAGGELGRASCRARVGKKVETSVAAVTVEQK